jgi:hypothetical protein
LVSFQSVFAGYADNPLISLGQKSPAWGTILFVMICFVAILIGRDNFLCKGELFSTAHRQLFLRRLAGMDMRHVSIFQP